jgi:hypothetical protein
LNRKEATGSTSVEFSEIVKKAYDRGVNEEITLEKLIEELKADLKQLVVY